MLIDAWLARAASARPEAIALEGEHGSLTYAQLLAAARAGAAELTSEGVRAGERIAIALPAGIDFACALHATLLAGAVAVPVDVRLGEAERAQVTNGVKRLIVSPLGGSRAAAQDAPRLVHELDSVAAVIHTSGTSATPKPVELTYGNFLWSALGSEVALGRDPRERWLCTLPVSHVGGLSILLRSAIGATTAVIHGRFETDRVLDALNTGRITVVSLVAATLQRLLDAGLEHPPHLRCALTGGGPVPRELVDRARAAGVRVSATYGLTEACSQVATTPLAALEGGARPLFCTRVETDDSSNEILVGGPTVARGRADRNGWLHTGDTGRVDAAGALHVTGRLSETIITGGENVAPEEVEGALATHPDVAEAGVFGRADARWGEAVSAVVVARGGAALDPLALQEHCASRLAPYKVPKEVRLVAGPLPRTSSGKLLRRELAGEKALDA